MSKTQEEFYYNKPVLCIRSVFLSVVFVILVPIFKIALSDLYPVENWLIGIIIYVFFVVFLFSLFVVGILPFLQKLQKSLRQKPALCINDTGIQYNGQMFFWNKIYDVSCERYSWNKDLTPTLKFWVEKDSKEHKIYMCLTYNDYQKIFDILRKYCEIHTIRYSNSFVDEDGSLKKWEIRLAIVGQPICDIICIAMCLFGLYYLLIK